jgi:PAS domain S-box-containing protein
MTSASYKIVVSILFACIALMLLFLFAEAILPLELHFSRMIHLASVICLCIALFMAIYIVRKTQNLQRAGHSREMAGMQREVDKTIRRYTSLLEGAGNAIFVFNADTGILEEVNRRGVELLGFSKEEMVSMKGKELFPPDEQQKFFSLVLRVKRRGRGHSDGLPFLRKDGATLLCEVEARLIDLGDENLVHAIVRDITFKNHYLREIRQRNSELSILNNILSSTSSASRPEEVLEITLREILERFGAEGGTIHLFQDGGKLFKLATSRNVSPFLEERLTNLKPGSEAECRMNTTQRCHVVETGATPCYVARVAMMEGWRCITAVPLLAKNSLVGIMHIMSRQDLQYSREELLFLSTIGSQAGLVIEHTRLFYELNVKNEELLRSHALLERSSHRLTISQGMLRRNLTLVEQANQEMKQLDRMKNHFLGMISHEFNTPLTSILGGAELLINNHGNLNNAEELQILEMVRNGGMRLSEIVTDLLKAAKLEAKADAIMKTPLKLVSILEFLHIQLRPLLEERSQKIQFAGLEPLPYFNGDQEYLHEVMSELLMNAMKFTPDGGEIIVTGRVSDLKTLSVKKDILCRFNRDFYLQISGTCYLEVEVRDRGIGIDVDQQLKIFEKFYEVGEIRHHSSSKHKFKGKGAGLGLAIVKGMVEAHGGMVWVESPALGRDGEEGTSFFLLLPLEEGSLQPELPFMRE